jgi:hypothetical protein
MQDFSSIRKALKEASLHDILLISFVALPFVLSAWLSVFKDLGYRSGALRGIVYAVIGIYLVGTATMVIGTRKEKRLELANDQVIAYLQSNDFEMMSLDRIHDKIDESYEDSFLSSVIDAYPNELRRAMLRGPKKGVARLLAETEREDEA